MAPARIGLALIGAVVLLTTAASNPRPAAADGPCDIHVHIGNPNGPVVTEGGGEFYRKWFLSLDGSGYPPSTTLVLQVLADGVLVHQEELRSSADGFVTRILSFVGDLAPPYDRQTEFTVILLHRLIHGACSDAVSLTRLPDPPFDDIVHSKHLDEIVWSFEQGLFAGCTPTTFCPTGSVPREIAAVVLVRAFALPPTTQDFFTDDESSRYEWAINRLAAAGLAVGCGPGTFCPGERLTRAQTASVLVAALDLPPSDVDRFADDDGSSHESAINALAAAGLTNGCWRFDPTLFCPTELLERGELAAYLFRAISE